MSIPGQSLWISLSMHSSSVHQMHFSLFLSNCFLRKIVEYHHSVFNFKTVVEVQNIPLMNDNHWLKVETNSTYWLLILKYIVTMQWSPEGKLNLSFCCSGSWSHLHVIINSPIADSYLSEEWKERHRKTADDVPSKNLHLQYVPLEVLLLFVSLPLCSLTHPTPKKKKKI